MKAYLNDIIPGIQRFSQKLDNTALLCSKHWVLLDDDGIVKTIYIFRPNGELILSQYGEVEKAHWECLGNQTLLIDRPSGSVLLKHGFFNEGVLALRLSDNNFTVLVSEALFDRGINSPEKVVRYLSSSVNTALPVSSIAAKQESNSADAAKLVVLSREARPYFWG